MTNYKLCISGPKWVLETLMHLINTFTNKKALGPYGKDTKHIQIYEVEHG